MSNKIIFFGNERLATGITSPLYTLRALLSASYEIVSIVIAQKENQTSRKPRDLEILDLARKHNIQVLYYSNPQEMKQITSKTDAAIGILVAFGKIIPQELIDAIPFGIINIHPSLLPLHRGPTPIESVLLNGESITGVSLMQLSAKMDSGKLFQQNKLTITANETKQHLADSLLKVGSELLVATLPSILQSTAKLKDQDDSAATYDKLINRKYGLLNWGKPAMQLEREVRAYAGWPKSKASIDGTSITITQAHVESSQERKSKLQGVCFTGENNTSREIIQTTPNTIGVETIVDLFMVDKLIPAGGKEMTAEAFLRGHYT